MKKLAFLLNNLSASQLSYYLIKNFNKYSLENDDIDYVAFYENYELPCITPQFSIMQIFEAYGYEGIMVATSLSTASKLLRLPTSQPKYFYVWDLEWMRLREKYFHMLSPIYSNKNLRLIARSADHAKIVEDCWNVKVEHIIEDCNAISFGGLAFEIDRTSNARIS